MTNRIVANLIAAGFVLTAFWFLYPDMVARLA